MGNPTDRRTPSRASRSGPLPTAAGLLVAMVGLVGVVACERIEDFGRYGGPDRLAPSVPQPIISRDLAEIRRSGTIRMLTRYNATSYFMHRGGEAGFDYELFQRFARSQGLALEVVIPEPGQDLVSLLNSGVGDVICAGLTVTDELDLYVEATRPVMFVNKVAVLPPQDPRPATIESLAGLTLTVPAHDPFLGELLRWRRHSGVDVTVQPAPPLVEAEELIARVSRGELAATVVADALVDAVRAYLDGDVRIGPVLEERRPVVWLVRRNSPELRAELNTYLRDNFQLLAGGEERRSHTYGIIYDRYFRNPRTIRSFQQEVDRPDKSGRISRYDELIRAEAARHAIDWRLVAALIYQESRFQRHAVSSAGAQGLMQVIPRFAGPQADSLFVPEANLRAGLRLLSGTWNGFAFLDSLERLRFTLAAYHAGIGHLNDARRLAMDVDWDPNRWEGSLTETLPWLAQRRWYDQTRHGYYRGHETVRYVEEILNRYRMYMRLVALDPGPTVPALDDEFDDDLAASADAATQDAQDVD